MVGTGRRHQTHSTPTITPHTHTTNASRRRVTLNTACPNCAWWCTWKRGVHPNINHRWELRPKQIVPRHSRSSSCDRVYVWNASPKALSRHNRCSNPCSQRDELTRISVHTCGKTHKHHHMLRVHLLPASCQSCIVRLVSTQMVFTVCCATWINKAVCAPSKTNLSLLHGCKADTWHGSRANWHHS